MKYRCENEKDKRDEMRNLYSSDSISNNKMYEHWIYMCVLIYTYVLKKVSYYSIINSFVI